MRRVIVISDLHIGGAEHPMLGHPEHLVDFLEQLAAYVPAQGEEVELVINGDFVDFLAEKPYAGFTASESEVVEKLTAIRSRLPEVFSKLAFCANRLSRFTILLGNHDVELAFPRVRESLLRALGTEPHRCLFVCNNETYRVGELLIEHGNRYDPWNAIDYDGLRELVSCASRGEVPPKPLSICPGSRLVEEVMNPLKERYHFVDLLKPEDKIVTLMLLAFEPQLLQDLHKLFKGAQLYVKQHFRKAIWRASGDAPRPGQRRFVARSDEEDVLPPDVEDAFAEELEVARANAARQPVGLFETLRRAFLEDETESLKAILEKGDDIGTHRIRQLQVALAKKMQNDKTFVDDDKDSEASRPYVDAARQMVDAGVAKVVVMGHTHLRRHIRLENGGRYLNTGTWADLIVVDDRLLEENAKSRVDFIDWIRCLATNRLEGIRDCDPTYADVRLTDAGLVIDDARPMLRRHRRGDSFA
ncbi:metallophosphoesterase [Polyangium fumosum]|uniref:Calcineurin-like phosphoesterase domain-containing protein n=1 Tax=Polyangium fumosum TaxID=889272 RepID=A0A4U1JCT3_9BACT|nr:metallophosphoesterase [Polyangium fumosum]TKD08434.1 hypothetical protein E8A74_16095 [Polyangium fumosum]